MSKEKQTSDAINAGIQKAGQAPVEYKKAAKIEGHQSGNRVPPVNEETR